MIFYRDLAQFGERQQADLSASQETQGVYIYIYMYTHTHVYTIYIYIYSIYEHIWQKQKIYIPRPSVLKQTNYCLQCYLHALVYFLNTNGSGSGSPGECSWPPCWFRRIQDSLKYRETPVYQIPGVGIGGSCSIGSDLLARGADDDEGRGLGDGREGEDVA